MITLRASGNRVKIEGPVPPPLRDALDKMLSYQAKGVEFAPSVREGKWDGITRLYDSRYGRFPRGYLRDVEAYLALEEVPYLITTDPFPDYPVVNVGWIGPALFDYQREAVNAARGAWRGVIALPTGTGKTLVAIHLISHLRLPAVILVPRLELVDQWERSLKAYLVPTVRIGLCAEGKVDLAPPIVVATNQTATRLAPGMLHKFGVVVLDEAHHVPSEVLSDYAKSLSSPYIFGLSATPWREDGRDKELVGAVGPTIFAASLSDMIERGFLARPTVEFVTVPPRTFSRRLKYEEVVTEYVVKNEERNRLVIAAVKRYEGRQIYVHVRRIIHGEALASRIPGAAWISGTTDSEKRRAVLDHFRSGTLKVLVSTLLGEGVDIPNMEVLVLAAGGKSATATIQTIGRVLRVTASKKEVVIVDFEDGAKFLYDHAQERRRIYESEPAIRIRGVP